MKPFQGLQQSAPLPISYIKYEVSWNVLRLFAAVGLLSYLLHTSKSVLGALPTAIALLATAHWLLRPYYSAQVPSRPQHPRSPTHTPPTDFTNAAAALAFGIHLLLNCCLHWCLTSINSSINSLGRYLAAHGWLPNRYLSTTPTAYHSTSPTEQHPSCTITRISRQGGGLPPSGAEAAFHANDAAGGNPSGAQTFPVQERVHRRSRSSSGGGAGSTLQRDAAASQLRPPAHRNLSNTNPERHVLPPSWREGFAGSGAGARSGRRSAPCGGNGGGSRSGGAAGWEEEDPDAWRAQVGSKVVEFAWEKLAGALLQTWVYDTWWSLLSPDRQFPAEARRLLYGGFGRLAAAARARLDVVGEGLRDVCEAAMGALEAYRAALGVLGGYEALEAKALTHAAQNLVMMNSSPGNTNTTPNTAASSATMATKKGKMGKTTTAVVTGVAGGAAGAAPSAGLSGTALGGGGGGGGQVGAATGGDGGRQEQQQQQRGGDGVGVTAAAALAAAREALLMGGLRSVGALHPAFEEPDGHYRALAEIAEALLDVLWPAEDVAAGRLRPLLRELLAGCVLRPVMMLATPHSVNRILALTLPSLPGETPLTPPPPSPSSSAATAPSTSSSSQPPHPSAPLATGPPSPNTSGRGDVAARAATTATAASSAGHVASSAVEGTQGGVGHQHHQQNQQQQHQHQVVVGMPHPGDEAVAAAACCAELDRRAAASAEAEAALLRRLARSTRTNTGTGPPTAAATPAGTRSHSHQPQHPHHLHSHRPHPQHQATRNLGGPIPASTTPTTSKPTSQSSRQNTARPPPPLQLPTADPPQPQPQSHCHPTHQTGSNMDPSPSSRTSVTTVQVPIASPASVAPAGVAAVVGTSKSERAALEGGSIAASDCMTAHVRVGGETSLGDRRGAGVALEDGAGAGGGDAAAAAEGSGAPRGLSASYHAGMQGPSHAQPYPQLEPHPSQSEAFRDMGASTAGKTHAGGGGVDGRGSGSGNMVVRRTRFGMHNRSCSYDAAAVRGRSADGSGVDGGGGGGGRGGDRGGSGSSWFDFDFSDFAAGLSLTRRQEAQARQAHVAQVRPASSVLAASTPQHKQNQHQHIQQHIQQQQVAVGNGARPRQLRASVAAFEMVSEPLGFGLSGEYVVYVIRVTEYGSGSEWTVARRFKSFEALASRLAAAYPRHRALVTALPAKRIFVHTADVAFVNSRRAELDAYLQQLLGVRELAVAQELQDFLKPESPYPSSTASTPTTASSSGMREGLAAGAPPGSAAAAAAAAASSAASPGRSLLERMSDDLKSGLRRNSARLRLGGGGGGGATHSSSGEAARGGTASGEGGGRGRGGRRDRVGSNGTGPFAWLSRSRGGSGGVSSVEFQGMGMGGGDGGGGGSGGGFASLDSSCVEIACGSAAGGVGLPVAAGGRQPDPAMVEEAEQVEARKVLENAVDDDFDEVFVSEEGEGEAEAEAGGAVGGVAPAPTAVAQASGFRLGLSGWSARPFAAFQPSGWGRQSTSSAPVDGLDQGAGTAASTAVSFTAEPDEVAQGVKGDRSTSHSLISDAPLPAVAAVPVVQRRDSVLRGGSGSADVEGTLGTASGGTTSPNGQTRRVAEQDSDGRTPHGETPAAAPLEHRVSGTSDGAVSARSSASGPLTRPGPHDSTAPLVESAVQGRVAGAGSSNRPMGHKSEGLRTSGDAVKPSQPPPNRSTIALSHRLTSVLAPSARGASAGDGGNEGGGASVHRVRSATALDELGGVGAAWTGGGGTTTAGVSAPLYELVDVLFGLQGQGFFRRQVISVTRQMLSLLAGDALDTYVASQLRHFTSQHSIARAVLMLHGALFPGGVWYSFGVPQPTPQGSPPAPSPQERCQGLDHGTAGGHVVVSAVPSWRPSPPLSPETYLEPGPPPPDAEQLAQRVRARLFACSPAVLVNVVGARGYGRVLRDVWGLLQSRTLLQHTAYGLLVTLLMRMFPELRSRLSHLQLRSVSRAAQGT